MTTKRPFRVCTLIAAFALCGVLAAPAQADVEKGTGEFGIDIGYTEWDSNVANNGPRFGLRLGYYFTDVIGLEVQGSYASESDEGDDTELTSGLVNAIVNVPHKRNLIPYFGLGIGGAKLDLGSADDTGLTAQAIGGARFYGEKGKFGFRFEGGFQYVDTFDRSMTNWNLSVGFTWTIGGPHPHQAPDNWGRWGR